MYTPNGYFHPIAAAQFHQPIQPLLLPPDGLVSNDEHLNILNEQMLFNEAKNAEGYTLENMSTQQVRMMCSAIEKQQNIEECLKFLDKLESTRRHNQTDPVLKLKCKVLYEQSQFEALYQIIENHHFGREYHRDLQVIWDYAHYKETESVRGGRGLDPVGRYRVRKKHTYPKTIWDGERTSYCFKTRDRKMLKEAYEKNPMPNQAQKQELAQKTELNVTQVSNWFKNQRQRARQHKRDQKGQKYAHSVTDDYTESEREDSGRSGNSGSRGSNPLSEDDEQSLSSSHMTSIGPFGLVATQPPTQPNHPTTSTTLPTNSSHIDLSFPSAAATTSLYNNFNFAPHFENYWPTSTNATMMNGFSAAAQMYYPLGMYSYSSANCPTYPTSMYSSSAASKYIKMMNPDPTPSNLLQNENIQYQNFSINANTEQSTEIKYPKYEPPNSTNYQAL